MRLSFNVKEGRKGREKLIRYAIFFFPSVHSKQKALAQLLLREGTHNTPSTDEMFKSRGLRRLDPLFRTDETVLKTDLIMPNNNKSFLTTAMSEVSMRKNNRARI